MECRFCNDLDMMCRSTGEGGTAALGDAFPRLHVFVQKFNTGIKNRNCLLPVFFFQNAEPHWPLESPPHSQAEETKVLRLQLELSQARGDLERRLQEKEEEAEAARYYPPPPYIYIHTSICKG